MRAKTFTQFILENLNIEEVDELLHWLDEVPFYPREVALLWAADFTGTRAQFEERIAEYPELESRLELEDIYIRLVGTEGARELVIEADWNKDADWQDESEQIDMDNLPRSIILMPLSEVEDEEEQLAALVEIRLQILHRMALDESLDEEWYQEVVRLGDPGALQRLCQNPRVTAETLLQVVAKIPEARKFAEKNPNWPSDVTDWALGDW
jgi:hypothetical protein